MNVVPMSTDKTKLSFLKPFLWLPIAEKFVQVFLKSVPRAPQSAHIALVYSPMMCEPITAYLHRVTFRVEAVTQPSDRGFFEVYLKSNLCESTLLKKQTNMSWFEWGLNDKQLHSQYVFDFRVWWTAKQQIQPDLHGWCNVRNSPIQELNYANWLLNVS